MPACSLSSSMHHPTIFNDTASLFELQNLNNNNGLRKFEAPPLPPRVILFSSVNLPQPVPLQKSNNNSSNISLNSESLNFFNDEIKSLNNNNYESFEADARKKLRLSRLSIEKLRIDGESVCFSGWVQLFGSNNSHGSASSNGSTSTKHDESSRRRVWAVIRNNQLCFMDNDEVIFFINNFNN